MARSTSSFQTPLTSALHQQELRFEERYDQLVAQFHFARAAHHQAQALHTQAKQAYTHLQAQYAQLAVKFRIKQELVQYLLPFYPHPITPELRQKIDLS